MIRHPIMCQGIFMAMEVVEAAAEQERRYPREPQPMILLVGI